MEDLGELSYLNSVEHLLNDMRNMRCVSKENFVTLTREKRLFSVTLGVDSAVTIEDTLRKFTDIVTSRFHPVIAIDVEGKAVGSGAVPDLSKIHLGNPYTPIFLEINFPRDDKGKYRGAAADVAPIKNLFDVDDIVFAGSAMSEDILMIEQTLSTIGTEPWTMVGNTLDVAAMWVCLGNWTRNSYGVQALTYIISGGIQLKNFKLSCAKDWSIDWRNLDWSHTVYNIGDQLSIINALYTLLTMLIPTLFPCKREAFEAFGPEFPTIFNAFFIEQFLNVQLLEQQFQRSDPWNRRRCVLLSSDDLVRVRNPTLRDYMERSLEKMRYDTGKILDDIGDPVLFLRGDWVAQNSSFLPSFREALRKRSKTGYFQFTGSTGIVPNTGLCLTLPEVEVEPEGRIRDKSSSCTLQLDASPIRESRSLSSISARSAESKPPSVSPQRSETQVIKAPSDSPEVTTVEAIAGSNSRVSRWSKNPISRDPSGYVLDEATREKLQEEGTRYIDNRDGRDVTMNTDGKWWLMLSIREMLRVVSKEEIYEAVRDQPLLGLSWITSATAWGSPPTPTSFRFTYASHYRNIVRIVKEKLPNVHVKNPHPFLPL